MSSGMTIGAEPRAPYLTTLLCTLRGHPLELTAHEKGGIIYSEKNLWTCPWVDLSCRCGTLKEHRHSLSGLSWLKENGIPAHPPPSAYTERCKCGYEG